MDLAILGTGLMPFGRHDGVTPIEMGVTAAHAALEENQLPSPSRFSRYLAYLSSLMFRYVAQGRESVASQ